MTPSELKTLEDQLAVEAKDWRHNAYSRVTFAIFHDKIVLARANQGATDEG